MYQKVYGFERIRVSVDGPLVTYKHRKHLPLTYGDLVYPRPWFQVALESAIYFQQLLKNGRFIHVYKSMNFGQPSFIILSVDRDVKPLV